MALSIKSFSVIAFKSRDKGKEEVSYIYGVYNVSLITKL